MKQLLSQQRSGLRRTAVYSFMTVCVVMLVSVLTLLVLGYSFDRQDGKIEQGGLLQLNTIPGGARVSVDGEQLGSNTQTKKTVRQGDHLVEYTMDGYRLWSKSIYISPGQVGWVDYARLIPIELVPETVRTLKTVDQTLASPKRSYILLTEDSTKPVFELVDIRSDNVLYTTLELPANVVTAPVAGFKQKYEIVKWSASENYAIVRHTYGKGLAEWILLNRSDVRQSINISKTVKISPEKLDFAPGNDGILYAKTGRIVERVDVGSKTTKRMAVDVDTYSPLDDDTILYTTFGTQDDVRTVEYVSDDMKTPQVISTADKDKDPLYASMATYFGKRYLAIAHGTVATIYEGSFPESGRMPEITLVDAYELPSNPLEFYMSDNGRFVTAGLSDGFAVYDLDLKKYDRTKWVDKVKKQQPLHWLDNFMLWSDYGGDLTVYDFDGANQQTIMPVTEGFSSAVSPNNKYMYGFKQSTDGFELRRVLLDI